MKNALHNINEPTLDFLRFQFKHIKRIKDANEEMFHLSGINNFFPTESDFFLFLDLLAPQPMVADTTVRREYGDFQTPNNLCKTIVKTLDKLSPKILIEPTFGKGSFILSAIEAFPTLEQIHGVEIYEPYCWQTKFSILEFLTEHDTFNHPSIYLYNENVFNFDFHKLTETLDQSNILVLGNPPWVTNSELSILQSANVPAKSNFKSHNGIEAITGKGNFDIGEYIILMMLDAFAHRIGSLAMLTKDSVIKNVLWDLLKTNYPICNLTALKFDAKLHFNASVDASLFRCDLGRQQDELVCNVASLESPQFTERAFGWVNNKFVSDVSAYKGFQPFDGTSPFIWRQGVKHDCSRILELDFIDGEYKNGFNESVNIEDDLIFPLAKSSDIQNSPLLTPRKFVIITQKKIGEDTAYIAERFPLLNRYLSDNLKFFSERKSSIYNGKPDYAIFGIGEYSFKPYKVAISGLYKKPRFSLVQPHNGKPTMLDDTCYFLGFSDQTDSVFALLVLNSEPAQKLLHSLTFINSKRPYTKDVLMRIDLLKIAKHLGFDNVRELSNELPENILQSLTCEKWEKFVASCEETPQIKIQNSLFEQPPTRPLSKVS